MSNNQADPQLLLLLQQLLNQQNQNNQNAQNTSTTQNTNNNFQQFIGPQGTPINLEEMMSLIDQEGYQGGSRGASRVAIENLEEREINKKDVLDEKKCGICLEDFEVGKWVKVLPCRKHLFCDLCILEWLKKNNTCPICREELETLDYDHEQKKWKKKKKENKGQENDYPSTMYM